MSNLNFDEKLEEAIQTSHDCAEWNCYGDHEIAINQIKQLIFETIDPFDLVQSCNPDCTPEEHAYHQGTWDSFQKLEKMMAHAFNLKGE